MLTKLDVSLGIYVEAFQNRALDIAQLHAVIAQAIDVLADEHEWKIAPVSGNTYPFKFEVNVSI